MFVTVTFIYDLPRYRENVGLQMDTFSLSEEKWIRKGFSAELAQEKASG